MYIYLDELQDKFKDLSARLTIDFNEIFGTKFSIQDLCAFLNYKSDGQINKEYLLKHILGIVEGSTFTKSDVDEWEEIYEEHLDFIMEYLVLEDILGSERFDGGDRLIEELYFEDFCEDDIHDIYNTGSLPYFIIIDWKRTSDIIRQDFEEVVFQGVLYLYRRDY